MIFDKIENLKLYSSFNSHFDAMAKFIAVFKEIFPTV